MIKGKMGRNIKDWKTELIRREKISKGNNRKIVLEGEKGLLPETNYMVELQKQGKLPLTKMYWTWEEGEKMESSWWRYHR